MSHGPWHFSPTLRLTTLFYAVSLAALVLFAVLAVALTSLTTNMHNDALEVRARMDGARAAEVLKVHVLELSRLSSRYALTQASDLLHRISKEEFTIEEWLARAKDSAKSPEEQSLLDDADAKIHRFLADRIALGEKNPLSNAARDATPYLGEALVSLDALLENEMERADKAIDSSARSDYFSDRVALVSFAIAVFGSLAMLGTSYRSVYRPILHIYEAIKRYAEGDKSSRTSVEGVAELQLIAKEFNDLATTAAEFDHRRALFLAGMAHDLRNPLAALKIAVQLFQRRFEKLTDSQKQANLELIVRQVGRMESMTSSFLDAIRYESGEFTLNLQNVDITRIVRDATQLWGASTEKHTLVPDLPDHSVFAECDPDRLEQVLTNLISNAIKYSPEGGAIEIVLRVENGVVELVVKDQGMGIKAIDLSKIFEPFQRAIPAGDLMPGIGIGLWVSKRLIEAHKGTIKVESEPGRGSKFIVTFPAAQESIKAA